MTPSILSHPRFAYDRILFLIAVLLVAIGIYFQFDIATSMGNQMQMNMFLSQLRSVLIAAVVFCIVFFVKKLPEILYRFSFFFLLILYGLLIMVLFKGQSTQGGTRWLNLFGFSFQPSSLAHPILIIFFARQFARKEGIIRQTGLLNFLSEFTMPLILTFGVFLLIYVGTHLSTLIVLSITLIAMIFLAGFKKSVVVVPLVLIAIGGLFIVNNSAKFRSDRMDIFYKYSLISRVLGKQYNEISPDKAYQVRESLTAISVGGLMGVGSDGGRAKHLYLPDINSDFIFAIIGEQYGFIGGTIVIIAFTIFLYRIVRIGERTDSLFKKLLVLGFGVNIFITAIVNMGVSMSIIPATGLPLPFISYGGSALATNVGMLAVILNISRDNCFEIKDTK